MHRFAGLDGDRLRPQLAGSAARSRTDRPVPAPASLRRVEPLAAVFLGLHGVMVLTGLGGDPWQWAGVGLVLVAGLSGLGYVLVVRLAGPPVGPALAVARGVLLAGLALTAARAYARMANLAVEAELELGRRERLGRALLDALADPTSVLDAQGRIVAANQVWNLRSAEGPAGPALGEVGQSYPAACQAAAAAGYDGLAAAAEGVRGVLSGRAALFRCRYQAPGGTEPYELTVTPLADGDGAVVTHQPASGVR